MDKATAQAITLDSWRRQDPMLYAQAVAKAQRLQGGPARPNVPFGGFGDGEAGLNPTSSASTASSFDNIMDTLASTYATVKGATAAAAVTASKNSANGGVVSMFGAVNWPLVGGIIGLGLLGIFMLKRGKKS